MITSVDVGRITAGGQDVVMHQRTRTARPNPVIYCPSASTTPTEIVASGLNPTMRQLVNHGFVVIAPDLDLTWGNATSRSRINDALSYATTQFGANAAPILVGASHGATAAITYALDGTTTPACVVTVLTIADLKTVQSANTGGSAAGITAAWGSNPVPSNADTLARSSELSAIPFHMHYSSDDAYSANITTFAATHGNVSLDNVGALGHTDAAMAAANINAIVDFVNTAV